MNVTVPAGRDLRLDFFRGLALWLIFLDHIPHNLVNWITIRNFGFSDAAEIFVFISGYTAAFVYGRAMRERGFVVASARVLKRVWQIYVAHIFLFVIYMAEIAYVSVRFDNPLFSEEMGIFDFLKQPDVTLLQALLLKFKPANMDILPLYIVLLTLLAPTIWLLLRRPSAALAASASVYCAAIYFDINLPSYPSGQWVFNPFAWQLLFTFGAWCALASTKRFQRFLRSPYAVGLALAYLAIAFLIVLTWHFPRYGSLVPRVLADWMYPIDKTNLDILRLVHFLALATLAVRFIPADSGWLKSSAAYPAVLCGQHSLEIFCLGVFLSFAGHFVLSEISSSILAHFGISLLGIAIMVGTAALFSWYKRVEGQRPGPPARPPGATLAGGEV